MLRVASAGIALLLIAAAGARGQQVDVQRPAFPTALLRRADALLAANDVSGARRIYERAAQDGVAEAATAAGRTYDPRVLRELRSTVVPDPARAASWYRRAIELGDAERAQPLLNALENR